MSRVFHLPARATDPSTSHEAAEDITRSGVRAAQQQIVADAVRRFPGLTSFELAIRAGLDRYVVARRLSEIEETQAIRRGAARLCAESNRKAMTWWPVVEMAA